MTFADIQPGLQIFLDANTLVYHLAPHPVLGPACNNLMARIERNEITASISTHVLIDVAHRVMTMEAMAKFSWPAQGIAQRLRKHPAEVQTLAKFKLAVEDICNIGIKIISVEAQHVLAATPISQKFGILSGDALIVSVMQSHGLSHLASHDSDFDRVPGLIRFAPG
jgi:predicted nucleic acid-binding protein